MLDSKQRRILRQTHGRGHMSLAADFRYRFRRSFPPQQRVEIAVQREPLPEAVNIGGFSRNGDELLR